MSIYDLSIHKNPDAGAWVAFFRQCNPDCNVSDELMITWFSNAMMAMHDHLVRDPLMDAHIAKRVFDAENAT